LLHYLFENQLTNLTFNYLHAPHPTPPRRLSLPRSLW